MVELQHIKEWAVYRTHDASHMIALCPACHDSVDRGQLTLSDEELYSWKGIERADQAFAGSIFVEPGGPLPALLFGSIEFMGPAGITMFDFAGQRLSLAVRDGELLVLNLKLTGPDGRLLADVVDNYVRQRDPSVSIESRTGRWRVRADLEDILPVWAKDCLAHGGPDFAVTGLDLLDIEVVAPGKLSVSGAWVDDRRGVIADRRSGRLLLLTRKTNVVLNMRGPIQGRRASMMFFGDLNQTLLEHLLVGPNFW